MKIRREGQWLYDADSPPEYPTTILHIVGPLDDRVVDSLIAVLEKVPSQRDPNFEDITERLSDAVRRAMRRI
jgi:hypothetical protein